MFPVPSKVAASLSQSGTHRLQFLMGGRPLPYDITVFQAVEQYGARSHEEDGDTVSASQLFQKTHTIYYRSVDPGPPLRESFVGRMLVQLFRICLTSSIK